MLDEQDRQAEPRRAARGRSRSAGASPRGSCRRSARRAAAAWARSPAPGRSPAGAGRRTAGSGRASGDRPSRPTRSSSSSARACASSSSRMIDGGRRIAPNQRPLSRWCRPTSTFSSAVMLPNSRMFWNVRAMPRRTTSWGLRPVSSVAVERDRALGRDVQAGDHVEERGLAGAVRPDEADDAAARDREVDVADGHQAAEPLGAAGRDEQVAGDAGCRPSAAAVIAVSSGPVVVADRPAASDGSASDGIASGSAAALLELDLLDLLGAASSASPAAPVTSAAMPMPCISALAVSTGNRPSGSLDHHDRQDHAEDQVVVVDQVEVRAGSSMPGRVAERIGSGR